MVERVVLSVECSVVPPNSIHIENTKKNLKKNKKKTNLHRITI